MARWYIALASFFWNTLLFPLEMLLLHRKVIHVTILHLSEERQHEAKWLTCIFRNNMMAMPNLEPVVLDLRSNLHVAAILPLNHPRKRDCQWRILQCMTCWLCVRFHCNNWILTALLKLSQAYVSDLCACEFIYALSIHQHYEYFAVTGPSSLLTGWFGYLQPYVTRTRLSNYLWYLTLHNNCWLFFFSDHHSSQLEHSQQDMH